MNAFSDTVTRIHFEPFFAQGWLITLCCIAFVLLTMGAIQHSKALVFRVITIGLFLLALFNPSLLQKERIPTKDVAVLVVDDSMSQNMGVRTNRTEKAQAYLEEAIGKLGTIDLRIVHAPEDAELSAETRLFDALDRTLADVPQSRRAGVIFLTDGQVHDIPQNLERIKSYGPIHTLLTGDKREKDRRIDIIQNPSYGIVGDTVNVTYTVTQTSNIGGEYAAVTLNRFDGKPEIIDVPIGVEQTIELPLYHAGENIFELSVKEVENEITNANNRAAIRINGVRDRLRVLLVSGRPHAGGRTWRDLLTSDPGVDLVHFTILREPEKMDSTPQNELALIAFPFRELFEIKLYDFDLIIFDRYRLNRILPEHYFNNIATYVRRGGALLEASGPSFAAEDSIFYTDLGSILPATPDGNVISAVFKPHISALGQNHPVTENLDPLTIAGKEPSWGPWLRQVSLQTRSGDTLMTGYDDKPLLILDRVGEGRVAQIASDNIWLWSRGFEGGGPHAELLRRTVHWLMKEPELDERALKVMVDGRTIRVRSRDLKAETLPLEMIKPDGTREDLLLERDKSSGFLETHIKADQLGIYAFGDVASSGQNAQKKFVIIGEQNPPELRDVLTTGGKMKPLSDATDGGVLWLETIQKPTIRTLKKASRYAGNSWIGLRSNNEFTVKSVHSTPLLPTWAWFGLLTLAFIMTWWREGRAKA